MSFFKKLFGGSKTTETTDVALVKKKSSAKTVTRSFGRYTDCNKNKTQLAHWSEASTAFKAKDYVKSYTAFLNYVRDEAVDNLTVREKGDGVEFEFIQGSKKIFGRGNATDFVAESNLALMETQSIPVMRKLVGLNFGLRYSKFALNGDRLCMKFSSHAIDASPNKLYAALRELAKKADQQDDLLLSEFSSSLKPIEDEHILPVNEAGQTVKYEALLQWISETKAEIAKLDAEKFSGGIAFLLLYLTYKIDYLICPQGELTDALERIQSLFFKKNDWSTTERNNRILEEFDRILAQPEEKIREGLYDVKCTFALANAAKHKTVMDMMFKEREKVAWYRDNGYPLVEEAVYGYMVSYAFFNYGMIYPVTDVLNVAMHVLNPEYYQKMGDTNQLVNADDSLNQRAIEKLLLSQTKKAQGEYPYFNLNPAALNYQRKAAFLDSLIIALDKVDLRKAK